MGPETAQAPEATTKLKAQVAALTAQVQELTKAVKVMMHGFSVMQDDEGVNYIPAGTHFGVPFDDYE